MEDEEYKKLPLDDRCVHKLWKARVNGYEEVAKLFRQIDDDKSPEFGKYLGLVKQFVVDSNAMGQEKGLEATLAYIENYAHAGKTVGEVMSGVVAKCIAAPKTRTRALALQVTLMYIEIEKQDVVQEELLKGMEQKNPKIVAACVNASTVSLREFGSKIVGVKPLVKKISTLFADRDKTVRDEARQMVVEMYRWIGAALRSQLANLQPVQVTELEAEFAKVEGQKAIPSRYVRSQQQKQTVVAADADPADGGAAEVDDVHEPPQLDPYDLADPVHILSELPKDFYEKIEAKKWQERKESLEGLENLVKSPKLQNGDYGDLVRALKKVIEKDSNVICVALAGRSLTGLASGLKKRFQPYSGACVSSLLEKFKERKQNVVTAIKEALDAIYLTTSMEAILDDVVEALANKNPSVKTETSLFLARSFTKTPPTVFNKKLLKTVTTALLKNINDSDPAVRDSCAEAIGTLMKLVGEKAAAPFLTDLEKDNLKMAKVKEYCDSAVITVKVAAPKRERPTTAPLKQASVTKPTASTKSAPVLAKKKTENSAPVKPKGKGPSKTAKTSERELSDEEVDDLIQNVLSPDVMGDMSNTNWKARMAASELFLKNVQAMDGKDLPAQALVKALARKPGLKDTNFQVLKIKLDIVKYIAENTTFSTVTANCCIPDITEKFGDPKNGNLACETLTSIAEATSLAFVSSNVIEITMNHKNPKVIQEALIWLSNAIREFGFANLNHKIFIENAKKALSSSNPTVRQAAISFCGVLYLYMGAALHVFFENEKPVLRDQINVEFDKYHGERPPAPTRGVVKSESLNSLDDLNEDFEVAPPPNPTESISRVDISGQITESLINELEDKNWKVRNEALAKVNAIIQEAKFIKSNIGDLPLALTHRLSDSNAKLAQTALRICSAIAKAMGAPCKQYVKVFFPHVLQNLGDNKSWMRASARETIETYVEQCGCKDFFENEMIADALKSGSPMLRIELWGWLAEKLPNLPPKAVPKEELVVCIPHLFSNLEDRQVEVRKVAQEAILGLMIHLGYDAIFKLLEKLKPSSRNTILPSLEKVRPLLPVKPLPKKANAPQKEEKTVKPKSASAKSVKSKGSTASAKSSSAGSRKKEEDVDNSPLLMVNNLKHQRSIDESKLRVLKWNFTTPREEFVELLRDQMTTANVNKNLIFNMFHTDFRFHIKAIEALVEDLSTNGPALMANLDLILKWLTLRFFDTNPSVLLKGLEYLHSVFNMLTENEYNMLENEASSFLPYLVLKIGDPKDSVRNGVRALFRQIGNVYPVNRLFTYIMEGLKSKNARQRAECLEALGSIIQDNGIEVCSPSPAYCLKEVAKQISDRDNSVRNAALNCVVEAFNIVGEKVYKMIGNISDKDLSLLEERIKRASRRSNVRLTVKEVREVPPPPVKEVDLDVLRIDDRDEEEDEPLPPVIVPQLHQPTEHVGPFSLDAELVATLDGMVANVLTVTANLSKLKIQQFDLRFLDEEINIPDFSNSDIKSKVMPISPPKPLDPNATFRLNSLGQNQTTIRNKEPLLISNINQISSRDVRVSVQGIEYVTEFLQSEKYSALQEYENEFIGAIVMLLQYCRSQDPRTDSSVLGVYKAVLTVLDWFYRRNLGPNLSTDVLKDIITEFINILVDAKLQTCHNGDAFVRVVNLHCVKIIEKSEHTRMICALVNLIRECTEVDNSARRIDLVRKCLWRVIKLMPIWGENVDYELVLLEVHNFLKEFPSSWWKNKPSDTTLRTIKTILHSSVQIKGASILLHLGKISNPAESEVESYLIKILQKMNLDSVGPPPKADSEPHRLSKATHNTLTEIFQKIGCEDETKAGLKLLYEFMQHHPEADIEPFLKKSSKLFQDYIEKGLREIEVTQKVSSSLVQSDTETQEVRELKGPEFWEKRLERWQNAWKINQNDE